MFSLELLPRITQAQSMDVLSSQANLAGYKAVVESFGNFEKAIQWWWQQPELFSTKVLVVGAGVAGLQAIASAKRMGAIVFATDVRTASKEQLRFRGKVFNCWWFRKPWNRGGYAKASDEFKKKQEDLLSETLKRVTL